MSLSKSQEKSLKKAIEIVCKLDNEYPGTRDIEHLYDILIGFKE